MKNKISILIFISLCIISCNGKRGKVTISGDIKSLTTNEIYLYGQDGSFDYVDTIKVNNGSFDSNIDVDALSAAFLLINNESEYPIYFKKGDHIKIKGNALDLAGLKVTGNHLNDDFTEFKKTLSKSGDISKMTFTNEYISDKSLLSQAQNYISTHGNSLVSIYLIDKYFVHQTMPDYPLIKQLISKLSPSLRKIAQVTELSDYINRWERSRMGAVAPTFSLPDDKGGIVMRTNGQLQNKYILLTFWASWTSNRAQTSAEMRQLYNAYHSNPRFEMVNISLDTDKAEWKRSIKQDMLQGIQLCDLNGFNSPVVNQFAVTSLPSYFLIAPDGVILARDMLGQALQLQIDAALK